jgi:hypothetical protein
MLIVFFDIRGIIHTEFVPQGTTVNSHYYQGVRAHASCKTRQMAAVARQRPFALRPQREAFFGEESNHNYGAPSLFARFGTSGLFFVSENQEGAEGTKFRRH